ncbi:DUF3081 domain-containing protein [Aliidiomarina halalkaliphila]|uniref:DUF3081 domain-containing protein n=1 Tax=Aliidiomarina halalkaliphila TaxID=2593535 RepID=A0A552X079_9GAMM|nr:DUF3081 family protein [Aliidiomarina halalkaliphila]TRW48335.1 DUF3081 domain-containing protein [Aliidiomarina halalkaliphila]
MKDDLSVRMILSVFEKVQKHGEHKDERHELEGITGFTDHDGYTVFLEGFNVKLRTGFHNTYHLDYDSERAFGSFAQKLKYIDENYD